MSRWKIKIQDDVGRARIIILDGPNTIGVITMPWRDYALAIRSLLGLVKTTSNDSINRALGDKLWRDAQENAPLGENSAELAMQKLKDFGWNEQKVQMFADHLTRILIEDLAELLPEHLP